MKTPEQKNSALDSPSASYLNIKRNHIYHANIYYYYYYVVSRVSICHVLIDRVRSISILQFHLECEVKSWILSLSSLLWRTTRLLWNLNQ